MHTMWILIKNERKFVSLISHLLWVCMVEINRHLMDKVDQVDKNGLFCITAQKEKSSTWSIGSIENSFFAYFCHKTVNEPFCFSSQSKESIFSL